MKKILLIISVLIFLNAKELTIPTPKIFSFSTDTVSISKKSEINASREFINKYKASFDSIKQTINENSSVNSKKIVINFIKLKHFSNINEKYKKFLDKNESYMLIIGKDNINIFSKTDEGLLNGLSTLEYLIESNKGNLKLGFVVDYPDIKMRVLHIALWPCKEEDFKSAIRLARLNHFNKLILLIHYGVDFDFLRQLKIKKKKWSVETFKKMVAFAKQNGFEIIPELKLLSHQKKFLNKAYPQYMYNTSTYNPNKKELYEKIIFPAIDEVLKITGAKRFHIGHDEIIKPSNFAFKKGFLKKGETQLPPSLYLKDVMILYHYLKKKNIQVWMWSDMLYTKKEFPSLKKSGANLNGKNGYFKLRNKIPKDIVMCVWHYAGEQRTFPTALTLANDGYKVLGASWKFPQTTKNYANYIYHLPINGLGMIATTWYGLSGKRKELIKEIIEFSGKAFWNAK